MNSSTSRRAALCLTALPLILPARAQAPWPTRPIRIILPFAPGGSPDLATRRVAEHWTAKLGQPVVVENRPGGGGVVATEVIARAAPDGYSFGIGNGGPLSTSPALDPNLPYHPLRDFRHLAMLVEFPLAIAVAQDSAVRDVPGLLALGQRKPGGVDIGTPGTAGPRLVLELLRQRHGAAVTIVPYRGGTSAGTEVAMGRLDAAMASFGEFAANDRLRVIALLSDERHPTRPEIPTLREQGFDVTFNVTFWLMAPAQLPDSIAARATALTDEAMRQPETQALLTTRFGAMPYRPIFSPALTASIIAENARWAEVVREGNLRPE